MSPSSRKIQTYFYTAVGLSLASVASFNSTWLSSAELHTLLEVVTTVLGLFIGVLALIRFYSLGEINYLVFGAGFMSVASLDAYHALVSSSWLVSYMPGDLLSLIPSSWFSSRLMFAITVVLSFLVIKNNLDEKSSPLLSPSYVFTFAFIATIFSSVFFSFFPLSIQTYSISILQRPAELLPAVLFLVALIGHYQLGNWRDDVFEHWLLIAITINLFAQTLYMPFSSQLFDAQFDLAHLLKLTSYICTLIGLSHSVFNAFSQVKSEASSRAKAQVALEASEVRNRTLMNSLADGLITINEKGAIETINNAACSLFGYSKLELLGKNIKMLMPDPYQSGHDGYLKAYKTTGKRKVIGNNRELVGLKKDGSIFPLNLTVSEMRIGNNIKYSGIVRDYTEQKKIQDEMEKALIAAESATIAKSNFLATMSHEIRTPMNGVIGMTEILNHTSLNTEQKNIVTTIKESGQTLIELINDILEFSKLEAGKLEIDSLSFNLERTAYDVIHLLTHKAEQKNIELNLFYHADCPQYIIGDAGRIRQILFNLIGNAIKFTTEGVVEMEISSTKKQGLNHLLHIEIKDTGIGIDNKTQEKLFQSFSQADSTTSRKYGGTGLGLAICKQLIELMKGEINVDSVAGKGSTFWFEIPTIESTEKTPLITTDLNNISLMYISPKNKSSENIIQHLKRWNMAVNEITNTTNIFDELLKHKKQYQLIMIDNSITGIDCDEFAKKAKQTEGLSEIPLILITSHSKQGSAEKHKAAGYSAYLKKPIISNILYETLAYSLSPDLSETNSDSIITRHSIQENKTVNTHSEFELSGNILLVEDVMVNQIVAKGLMQGYNLDIDVANNGEEAVTMAQAKQYDAILMDCQMPIMDGYTATQKIRETNTNVPIIALTANALSTDQKKCLDAGMSDYLSKPYNHEQLSNMLNKWLNKI